MLNVLLWVLFGAIAGWIVTLLSDSQSPQSAITNILIGIIGALIGGSLIRANDTTEIIGLHISGLLIAIIVSLLLLMCSQLFRRLDI